MHSSELLNNTKGLSTVRLLHHYVEPFLESDLAVLVLDCFINDKTLFASAIIDDMGKPVGLVERGRITEIFLKPFARDLNHKNPIKNMMDKEPIIIDINTCIDDLAQIIIESGMRHMVNGVIIVENGLYSGMATGHALLEEIAQRKQRDLFQLAHYDQLTGVPNRLLFKDRLQQACLSAKRTKKLVALIFVDLDRFKFINDTMGHSAGDQLLIVISDRLQQCMRESDTLARLGGDEFVVVLQNLESIVDAEKVAELIVAKIREPMQLCNRNLSISASLGLAIYPLHDENLDGLIQKADAAMYEVKQQGRNTYQIYCDTLTFGMIEKNKLESRLNTALENDQFFLVYQPQVDVTKNKMVGVEALLRWNHPELGLVPPIKFIPIAEDTGLIHAIGEWVLYNVGRQHREWMDQGMPPVKIAVNISPLQFRQKGFCDLIKAVIDETSIDPQYLELELTEGLMMTNTEYVAQTLAELRQIGIKLAIDDFGTGYSSLSYLHKFAVDRIKIDQSFIRNISKTVANQAIVRAIMALGNSLNIEMIAEGVESMAELEAIKLFDCQEIQGYLISRPIPANELNVWFQSYVKQHH